MNRRLFIETAASSLLIPHGVLAGGAVPPEQEASLWDYFFYDERFAEARRLAARSSRSEQQLTPVQGDITGIWNRELRRACRRSPLTMHGITTESFHFCLEIMIGARAVEASRVDRIGRDLFAWTIHSTATG